MIKLSLTDIYDAMIVAYDQAQRCERSLEAASRRGASILEEIRGARLSRAYQKTQMLATMYLVQSDRERKLT